MRFGKDRVETLSFLFDAYRIPAPIRLLRIRSFLVMAYTYWQVFFGPG
jgi:hypothetical protein